MSEQPRAIGPYVLGEQVARDGSGRSYASEDPQTGRAVTVKVLRIATGDDPGAIESFERSVQAASELRHPAILRLLGHGEADGRRYLVMEERPGPDLYRVLKQRRLGLQEAFRAFRPIAEAVQAAHARGIVQGDLSPRTISVSDNLSVVKLTDLGLPREVVATGGRTLTSTAGGTGALHFIAPERAVDPLDTDPRADVYSLGVIFYQMLTGKVPFGRFNLPSRVRSDVPPEVDPVVLRCLEADRAARYPSVDALLRDLGRLEDRLQIGLVSELRGIGQSIRKPTTTLVRHARGLMIGAVAVAVVGAAGFGAWSFLSRPQTPRETIEVERLVRDPLAGRPSESLAAAIDAVEPPAGEATSGDDPGAGSGEAVATTAPGTPGPVAGSAGPTAPEAGREAFEIAADKARNNLHAQAVEDLNRLLAGETSESVEADALSLRAQIEEVEGRIADAMATYTEIGTRFAGRKLEVWARYNFARLALKSDLEDSSVRAAAVFDEVATLWPSSEYAPRALASKAAIESSSKERVDDEVTGRKVPAAVVTLRALTQRYPDDPAAEQALWRLGQEYEELKLWRQAADAYWQLGTAFPQTGLDAWWRAGQVLDRRLDEKATAIQAYERVPDGSERHADAQKRINRLSR